MERKNYSYPDLPKAYQITQLSAPLCEDGYLQLSSGKKIRITRIQIEEDAGKLIHEEDRVLIDYNRCSVPLIEIVSEPDISSCEEAREYVEKLRLLMRYIGVSDCRMQEGSMRFDVNVSVRNQGEKTLGTRTEIKNMNSVSAMQKAMEYEYNRQIKTLSEGGTVSRETLRYDEEKGITVSMRSKEDAKDYTLNFTYMNAGYIGYYSTTDTDVDATVTMSVFLIRGDEVIITRYDSEINLAKNKIGIHNLKSPGVWHADYLKEDYHATPNTLEYASSRKVTATSDGEVAPPRYSPLEEEEPDEEPTTTTTTTVTTVKTDTSVTSSVTTTVTTTTNTTVVATKPTQGITEPSSATTDPTAPPMQDGGEETSSAPVQSPPWGLIFGIGGGAVLIIGFIVFVWVYKRKK